MKSAGRTAAAAAAAASAAAPPAPEAFPHPIMNPASTEYAQAVASAAKDRSYELVTPQELSGAVQLIGSSDNPAAVDFPKAMEVFINEEVAKSKALDVKVDTEFKNVCDLPLARIKRIMKSDEDVRMISAEAPVVFAKACEIFAMELMMRSWINTSTDERGRKRPITSAEILQTVIETPTFDFLCGVLAPGAKPAYLLEHEAARGGAGGGGSGARGTGRGGPIRGAGAGAASAQRRGPGAAAVAAGGGTVYPSAAPGSTGSGSAGAGGGAGR